MFHPPLLPLALTLTLTPTPTPTPTIACYSADETPLPLTPLLHTIIADINNWACSTQIGIQTALIHCVNDAQRARIFCETTSTNPPRPLTSTYNNRL